MGKQIRRKNISVVKNLLQRKYGINTGFWNTEHRYQVRLRKRFKTQRNQLRTEYFNLFKNMEVCPVGQHLPCSNGFAGKIRPLRMGLQHQTAVSPFAESFNNNQFAFLPAAHNSFTLSIGFNPSDPFKSSYSLQKSVRYRSCPAVHGHKLSRAVNGDEQIAGQFLKTVQNAHNHKKGADADNDSRKTYSRNNIDNPEPFSGKTETLSNPQPCFHKSGNNMQ